VQDNSDLGTSSTIPTSIKAPGYRLRREAGSDAIGIWFDAEQESLGRFVTVRVLKPQLEAHEVARREFLAEMDRLGPLVHPNLARVIDSHREGALFLVVERLFASTVSDLLEPGKPLGAATGLRITRGVARALTYLAGHGYAHKNLTPRLVSLREDGEPRLATFRFVITFDELAALRGRLAQDAAYVAPEQLAGEEPIGDRTPCYQIAAFLFHLLAGRAPHEGELKEVARAHLTQPFPSLKRYQPFLAPGIYDLIAACTARAPADRPPLPRVVAALEALAEGRDPGLKDEAKGPIAAPRPRRRRRR